MCKDRDNYEYMMDKQIAQLKKDLWLKDFESEITDKELLKICEFMNKYGIELSYIDLSICSNAEDILYEMDMVR